MLSGEVLRSLSTGHGKEYCFDFSQIPSDRYESLFTTLQKFAINSVTKLGFNCDTLKNFPDPSKLPHKVAGSIAKKKSNYIKNMVELLYHIVPKSRITEIVIGNLTLFPEQLGRLASSFSRSPVLKSITFYGVTVGDDGIQIFLKTLNPNKIERLVFNDCDLTSGSVDTILAFISRRNVTSGGIQSFDISGNSIPENDLQAVEQALYNKEVSLSPNKAATVGTPRRYSKDLNYNDPYLEEIAKLKEENQMLKNQIKALSEMKVSAELQGSIFVVGTGGPQFVTYLGELEDKLIEIDRNSRFV